jgi:hypothetical protein
MPKGMFARPSGPQPGGALAARVRTLESVIEVLHANLVAARRWVATLTHK